jgi:hypothetical protein
MQQENITNNQGFPVNNFDNPNLQPYGQPNYNQQIGYMQPINNQPLGYGPPNYNQPIYNQPIYNQPGFAQPPYNNDIYNQQNSNGQAYYPQQSPIIIQH